MTRSAMTFIEIMLAVLILAFAIIPISDMLSYVTRGTKDDKSETEAMQFACDLMDNILFKMEFDAAAISTDTTIMRGTTELHVVVETSPITWDPVARPKIAYHPPCAGGVETTSTWGGTDIINDPRKLRILDKEKVPGATTDDFDLLDIKMVVRWKSRGAADSELDRRPIVLYSRKARL